MNTPYRLWSLWEMLKKYGNDIAQLVTGLQDLEMASYSRMVDGELADEPVEKATIDALKFYLAGVDVVSGDIKLDSTPALVKRMRRSILDAAYTPRILYADLHNLASRIEDQLDTRHFLFVDPAKVHLYDSRDLFGDKVRARFPDAIPILPMPGGASRWGWAPRLSCI